MEDSDIKLVAAIDIGTSQSGYAYSFLCHPKEIKVSKFGDALDTFRTSSSILLDKGKKFLAYGQDAEKKFAQTANSGEDSHTLFRGFKKELYNNPSINKNTKIKDISGKQEVPALDILTMTLKYMKNHLMRTINTATPTYNENEVHFVVTVPAIWNNKAKALMREAAFRADIKDARLTIALDSECASLLCQTDENCVSLDIKKKGATYITVDLGGGTVDISSHESVGDGSVKTLHYPSGGHWGGTNVDVTFQAYLELAFGRDTIEELIAEHTVAYLELINEFKKKRKQLTKDNMRLSLSVPSSLITIAKRKLAFHDDADFRQRLDSSNFQLDGETFIIEPHLSRGMYDYSINCLNEELNFILKIEPLKNTNIVLLVGGLANSSVIQEALPKMLKSKTVVFPSQGDLAVVKGAVLYGMNTKLVRTRVEKLTYGIKVAEPYDEVKHKGGEVEVVNGVKLCTNVFHVLLKGGTTVQVGHTVVEDDKPLTSEQTVQTFEIYTSGKSDGIPVLTSDPTINKETVFTIPLPFGCLVNDKVFERCVVFGETEIKFKITFKKGNSEVFLRYLELK